MKLLSLSCGHCGAPLDVPHKARFVTCAFCDARLQVAHTGSTYYTEVMEAVDDLRRDVAELKRDAEIDRLDRNWERRKAELSTRDKAGRLHRPSVAGALMAPVAAVFFAVMSFVMGIAAVFPLMPVLVVGGGLAAGLVMHSRAQRFEREYQAYRSARRRLMEG